MTGECHVTGDTIENARKIFNAGEVPTIEMVTNIYNTEREIVAVVTTLWQVKPWKLVRK